MRGTGRVAVACRANVRLLAAPAGSTVAERAATARVFVDADKAERRAGAVPRPAGRRPGGPAGRGVARRRAPRATGDLRAVTVDADVIEPAAIPELVKSLRGVGAVSAAELTRVSGGTRRDPGADARRARGDRRRPIARAPAR